MANATRLETSGVLAHDRNGEPLREGTRVKYRKLWDGKVIRDRSGRATVRGRSETGALKLETEDGAVEWLPCRHRRGQRIAARRCGKYGMEYADRA